LCGIDPAKAETAIVNLGQLMRRALDNSAGASVELSSELECVRNYVWIEQQRLGSRASVEMKVDPTCHGVSVPLFSVQTLVENAVNHGIAQQTDSGRVTITVRRYPGEVLVAVADNGPGIGQDSRRQALDTNSSRVHGLQILNQQIILLYGQKSRLRLYSRLDAGTLAVFAVPTGAQNSC
jgi:LytS/YehU family sensor histidine kinase